MKIDNTIKVLIITAYVYFLTYIYEIAHSYFLGTPYEFIEINVFSIFPLCLKIFIYILLCIIFFKLIGKKIKNIHYKINLSALYSIIAIFTYRNGFDINRNWQNLFLFFFVTLVIIIVDKKKKSTHKNEQISLSDMFDFLSFENIKYSIFIVPITIAFVAWGGYSAAVNQNGYLFVDGDKSKIVLYQYSDYLIYGEYDYDESILSGNYTYFKILNEGEIHLSYIKINKQITNKSDSRFSKNIKLMLNLIK